MHCAYPPFNNRLIQPRRKVVVTKLFNCKKYNAGQVMVHENIINVNAEGPKTVGIACDKSERAWETSASTEVEALKSKKR